MLAALVAITGLAAVFGLLLGFSAVRFRVDGDPIADRVEALLPQTQCGQCTFPGCRPYAEAIVRGEADINQCPPGGEATIRALADLLDREPKPLNPDNGAEKPRVLALIDEPRCIGCTLCIQACPVDAIVGAPKQMHTVIAAECTGCELCLPPCPVDCIDLVSAEDDLAAWRWPQPKKVGANPKKVGANPKKVVANL
jgi:Na+-translocating ferredoxin:NAD+ oxidoreductase subunit B